jgi:hypothetical protein
MILHITDVHSQLRAMNRHAGGVAKTAERAQISDRIAVAPKSSAVRIFAQTI